MTPYKDYPEIRKKAETSAVLAPASCPCCGGDAEVKETMVYMEEAVFVRCKVCGLHSKLIYIDHPIITRDGVDESTRYTAEEARAVAISLWNRRDRRE